MMMENMTQSTTVSFRFPGAILILIITMLFQVVSTAQENIVGFDEVELIKKFQAQGIVGLELEHAMYLERQKFLEQFVHKNPNGGTVSMAGNNFKVVPITPPISSTGLDCNNEDIELGNFNNWGGAYGWNMSSSTQWNNPGAWDMNLTMGFNPTRQQITNSSMVDDCAPVSTVAPGGNYSIKLGDTLVQNKLELAYYTFTVTNNNDNFCYRYQVVMQHPGHSPQSSAYFEFKIISASDSLAAPAKPCTYQRIYAGQPGHNWQKMPQYPLVGTCNTHHYGGGSVGTGSMQYIPWTVRCVDLSAYIGQQVKAVFTNADCGEGGHWGVSYIDPFCQSNPGADTIPISMCNGNSVTLTAPSGQSNSTNNYGSAGVSYEWFPMPGIQNTVTQTVSTAGTYTAVTTVLNNPSSPSSGSCQFTLIYDVQVEPQPVAAFTPIPTACGTSYSFQNNSTSTGTPIATYSWSFGGGNTSNQQNPSYNFPGPGTYTVSLTVTTQGGCTNSTQQTITINPPVTANFTANPLCLGGATNFTNSSTGSPSGYQWNFGEPSSGASNTSTQTNPSHTYAAAGTYTVTLIAEGPAGCNDTIQLPITVDPVPVASFTSTTVCEGNPTTFNSTSTIAAPGTIASYSWGYGDGQNGTGQTSTHTYSAPGTFTTTLLVTSANGCTHSVQNQVTVNPGAVASFTADPLCLGATTNFTNTSTGAITSYEWNFGEPSSGASNTSTLQSPSHAYAAPGTYTVTLITVNPGGCHDTILVPITVDPLPVAAFNSSVVCEGNQTVFTDGSTINPGVISNWEWDFGDSQSSTSQNPSHSYPAAGTYTATLIVTSSNGCKDTIQNPVVVDPAPAADFNSNTVCLGAPTTFTDASQGSPSSWSWNFGEPASGANNVSSTQNPSHTYLSAGTYTVQLVVNTNGCIDTVEHTVVIAPSATADFTATTVCLTNATVFTDASSTAQGTVTNWLWDFGEPTSGANNTSTLQNPTHTYGTAGTYTVILGITTDQGCIDTIHKTIIVNPLPIANFTAPIVCVGSPMPFTDGSSAPPPATITNWSWNFGDGSIANTQNPSHTYATSGQFNVLLTITNSEGCQQNISLPVNVSPLPVAAFGPTSVCLNTATQFTDNSTGTLSSWDWDFGDGSAHATTQNPTHTYTAAGVYNVTLIIAAGSCMDTITGPVTVYELPVTNFSGTDVCLNQPTLFTDNSSVPNGGTVSTYSWNFGDGGTSNVQNPSYTYNTPGTYTVTLVTTSDNGCTDTLTKTVTVHPLPVADFSVNSVCLNSPSVFTDASQGSPSTWSWNFGEAGSASNTSTQQNPTHTYTTAGTFTTTLIVQTAFGCSDTATNPVTVSPIPVVAFTVNDTDGCVPLCVDFKDMTVTSGDPIVSWSWTMGDGGGATNQHPSYCYKTVGDYDVSLSVTSANGCTASFTELDYIHVYPYPNADFIPSPEVASYLDPHFTFTDVSTGAASWMWNFGDNGLWTSSSGSTEYTYDVGNTGIITFDVSLAITNQYGCADTIVKPIKIEPEWTLYVPNTFTPNGDGFNEGFIGKGIGILEYEMWIYDRWGNEIYHCTDINEPWNGKVQNGPSGEIAQIDTYVWLIFIKDIFEKKHRYIGHVNIVK